ncbi:outer membrane protein assembly factor BamA [Sphingomonas sp. ZT3P38]|uniref:outer membrane protein assembly factor BamA n=1 Tax=Parasphingomonas zepuensis TaxID=3096161 RepID=UPI002FC6F4D1
MRFLLGVLAFNALLGATANFDPDAIYDLIWRNAVVVCVALVFSAIKTSFRWAKSYVEFHETCEKFPAFLMKDLLLLRQFLGGAWGCLRRWAGATWRFFRWLGSLRLVIVSRLPRQGGPQLPGAPEPEPDPTGGGGGGSGGGGSPWRQVTQRRPDGSPVNWKIIDGGGIKALLDQLVAWLRAALGQAVPGVATPRRLRAVTASLLAGTILSGLPGNAAVPLIAKAPEPKPMHVAPVSDTGPRTIRSLRVEGSQRIEPDTVLSYTKLRVGGAYSDDTIDQAIRDLIASDLLADVQIEGMVDGDLIVRIRENPVINRVVFEGNKRLKQDKIVAVLKLRPRQIFTRTAMRADVSRVIDLYRQQGRFAATVEPAMVRLDKNRVDLVFAIVEGPVGKVRGIVGAAAFSDADLRKAMAPKRMGLESFWSDSDYDADRLATEQAQLREFYLTRGYADFALLSAVAELTPDKKDFIVTYAVEEGQRYRFGKVGVDSGIAGFEGAALAAALPVAPGDWYNAKVVEDAVALIATNASNCGFAFAEIMPVLERDAAATTIDLTFGVREPNRTLIERIDVAGDVMGKDKLIRREFRVAEGDAFNSHLVARSQDRINSLGYFEDKFETEDKQGLAPGGIALQADVEEPVKAELTLSAGFSSLKQFILQASIAQRNFRGKGQTVSAYLDYSTYSKSVELGFGEPYLFDRNLALGGTLFRRDNGAFNYAGSDHAVTYSQVSTGMQIVGAAGLLLPAKLDDATDLAGRTLLVLTDGIENSGALAGGRDYYTSRVSLDVLAGVGGNDLGLRPSVFALTGPLISAAGPTAPIAFAQARDGEGQPVYHASGAPVLPAVGLDAKAIAVPVSEVGAAPWSDRFMGDNARPRLTIGFAANWNFPFGPMRIDVAKALLSGEPGEDDADIDALPPARA